MVGLLKTQPREDVVDQMLRHPQILRGHPVRVQPRAHRLTEPLQHTDGAGVLRVEIDAALRAADGQVENRGLGSHAAGQVLHLRHRAACPHAGAPVARSDTNVCTTRYP